MYAHKAIDGIRGILENKKKYGDIAYEIRSDSFWEIMKGIEPSINNAIKFHGEFSYLFDMSSPEEYHASFHTKRNFPFDLCWFDTNFHAIINRKKPDDSTVNFEKGGVLTYNFTENLFVAYLFYKAQDIVEKSWDILPFAYLISNGTPIDEVPESELNKVPIINKYGDTISSKGWVSSLNDLQEDPLKRKPNMIILNFSKSHKVKHNWYNRFCSALIFFVESCLIFLDCDNVYSKAIAPPKRLNKKRAKKGKKPIYRYHVLNVKAGKHRSNQDKRLDSYGKNALHYVRRHYRKYGIDGRGKLFGKYVGKFVIPPHIRGNKDQGIVVKDYNIGKLI